MVPSRSRTSWCTVTAARGRPRRRTLAAPRAGRSARTAGASSRARPHGPPRARPRRPWANRRRGAGRHGRRRPDTQFWLRVRPSGAQGDDRNRTGVNGFAGRCVTTPPRRRGAAKRSERVTASARGDKIAMDGPLSASTPIASPPPTSVTGAGCSSSSRAAPTTRSSPSTWWPRPTRAPSSSAGASPPTRPTATRWRGGSSASGATCCTRRCAGAAPSVARSRAWGRPTRARGRGADPHRGARRPRRAALGRQGALAELGPEQREAVRLRVVDELGYPAVAARLGVSEQTARARVSRGLRALAAAVDRHETGAQGAT